MEEQAEQGASGGADGTPHSREGSHQLGYETSESGSQARGLPREWGPHD
jgi:hypothetical protein